MSGRHLRIVAVIPARLASSRFPGKPLVRILGQPMIEHVYRRACRCELLAGTYVATCDPEIYETVQQFGGEAIMTSAAHERASERVAEAAASIDANVICMVQGDEPMVDATMIERALGPIIADPAIECVNLVTRIRRYEEYADPNTIKVVMDQRSRALYFSRQPIPTSRIHGLEAVRIFKQVCVIPFRRDLLLTYARLDPTPLERAEGIDMLRLLEHGYAVHLVESECETHAVDVPEDVAAVEGLMRADPTRTPVR